MAGIKAPRATRVLIVQLESDQVGREFPLSAEKLSPILAFYSVANLAAGIALCRRLLEFGGLGHTCAIHSQNRAAVLEFGEAVPAFRVVVNSSSVHGSIGYSTNLFPAMTLGCGAPGGNVTSDNIGPQHLMNVKRIAWESRGVEHRTVPADQRLSGAATSSEVVAAQEPKAIAAVAAAAAPSAAAPSAAANAKKTPQVAKPEEKKPALAIAESSASGLDRAAVARVVASVLAAQGIARGGGASTAAPNPAPAVKELPSPASVAAEFASRLFGLTATAKPQAPQSASATTTSDPAAPSAQAPAEKKPEAPAKVAVQIQAFVSENDVRRAMTRSEKIFIGRKTILTPSARDLGLEHEVFVETEAGSIR
jgi:hypothetical protein